MEAEDTIIAMVAIKDWTPLTSAAVSARVKEMFPWIAKTVGMPPPVAAGQDGIVIPMGDSIVVVMPMNIPIPDEALTKALLLNWIWPEAEAAFKNSRAHLIVSALSPDNDTRRMRVNAQRVTCVAAALAEMTPAVGIYWSTAENVLEPKQFVAAAKAAGEDETPFDLWITTHVYPGPNFEQNQEGIARSSGLYPFIGREVECGPYTGAAGDAVRAVAMVSNYVLDRRVEFAGGETIGTPEEPIGTIQLGRTRVPGETIPIYRIELDGGATHG